MTRYGDLLRSIRVEKEITLRELALRTDIDVAYLSRVERCTISPPQKPELLDTINEALEVSSEEARRLKDQAALDNRAMPADIAEELKAMTGIPMLLRTVANKKLTPEQIMEITDFINGQY